MSKTAVRLRVAIVGCGAVTRASLLPVLAGHEDVEVVTLIDASPERARELARLYRIGRTDTAIETVSRDEIDAVVLATPPAHHASATIDAAGKGWHVFVEKPMATNARDAEAMVAAADHAGVALAVGLYRRLLPVSRLLRGLLESEMLGAPRHVDLEEGGEYTWQLASLAGLTRAGAGGGVLIDLGTHLLDQLFFVLPGTPLVTRYVENARGGVETDCVMELAIATRWGSIPARLELSRTRQLRGSVRVTCERGTLELLRGDFCSLLVHADPSCVRDALAPQPRPVSVTASWAGERDLVGYKAFRAEFDDWLNAIAAKRDAQLSGRSVLPVVRVIDACYAAPERLPERWVDGGLVESDIVRRAPAVLAGRLPRVLVTGAGGFLGCRTVECLQLGGAWDVRALVRRPGSAARLARWPLEVALGDITSPSDMDRAMVGCDAVVHCAVGTGWPPPEVFRTTVEGTAVVAEAARAAGVSRFVHVSSMAVHGERVPERLDESAALEEGTGFAYGRAKCLAERAVMDAVTRGLRTVILRPARIYGPYSRTFTTRPLEALRRGALVLAGDVAAPSNMVFVDNVVEAIVRALDASEPALGEAFLISEPDQLSWRAFFEYFAEGNRGSVRLAPYPERPGTARQGIVARWVGGAKSIVTSPELRGLAKRVMATDPYGVLPRRLWDASPRVQQRVLATVGADAAVVYRQPPAPSAEEVVFRIEPTLVVFEKATRLLGYTGLVPGEEARALTKEWAIQARLIG